MRKLYLVRALAFLLLLFLLLGCLQYALTRSIDQQNYNWLANIYKEPAGSLDAVYIGASNVYSTWLPPVAFDRCGITVYNYTNSSQPFESARFLILEARKSHPDALCIIGLNNLYDGISDLGIHYSTNGFRPSVNKFHMIRRLTGSLYTPLESMQYFVPFLRFHSRWADIGPRDLVFSDGDVKGGNVEIKYFFSTIQDMTSSYSYTTEAAEGESPGVLLELLDFCDREQIRPLFVASPQPREWDYVTSLNRDMELIRQRGYDVLDMMGSIEELGLDLRQDFYNSSHTNIHGAIKVTEYLAAWLAEHYGFSDKRGDAAYADWQQAFENYVEDIAPYTLDLEYLGRARDFSLPVPALAVSGAPGAARLSWEPVPGAAGYCVYRKTGDGPWQALASLGPEALLYEDESGAPGEGCTYTLVPFSGSSQDPRYGNFDYTGVSAG